MLPGARILTRVRYFIGHEFIQVFEICVEPSEVKQNVPEEHIYIEVSADACGLYRVEYCVKTIEKASLKVFYYVFKLH